MKSTSLSQTAHFMEHANPTTYYFFPLSVSFLSLEILALFSSIHSLPRQQLQTPTMVMVMANPSLLLKSIFFFFLLPCLSWSCPEYQKQALLQFKSSILAINSSLHTLDSWDSSSSCCLWNNVTCSSPSTSNSTSSVVIGLHLSDISAQLMHSYLLAPLFFIRSLRVLDISHYSINGQIPALGFGNLGNLVHLDLSLNWFNGSIPPQLFQLRHLSVS